MSERAAPRRPGGQTHETPPPAPASCTRPRHRRSPRRGGRTRGRPRDLEPHRRAPGPRRRREGESRRSAREAGARGGVRGPRARSPLRRPGPLRPGQGGRGARPDRTGCDPRPDAGAPGSRPHGSLVCGDRPGQDGRLGARRRAGAHQGAPGWRRERPLVCGRRARRHWRARGFGRVGAARLPARQGRGRPLGREPRADADRPRLRVEAARLALGRVHDRGDHPGSDAPAPRPRRLDRADRRTASRLVEELRRRGRQERHAGNGRDALRGLLDVETGIRLPSR